MIIQCDSCQTKFKLNESAIKGAGVKVRCTKCQSIFVVTRPEELVPSEPPPSPSYEIDMDESLHGGLTDEDLGLGSSQEDEPQEDESFEPPAEESAGGVTAEEETFEPSDEEGEDEAGLDFDAVADEPSVDESVGGVTAEEETFEPPGEEPEDEAGLGFDAVADESSVDESAEEDTFEPLGEEPEDEAGGEDGVAAEDSRESEDENVEDESAEVESAGGVAVDEADWGLGSGADEESPLSEEGAEQLVKSHGESADEESAGGVAVDEADWGLDSGADEEGAPAADDEVEKSAQAATGESADEESAGGEAVDEADWGLGSGADEELPNDDGIDDDEDWGLGEDDEVAGSVEDYTSKLKTEIGSEAKDDGADESALVEEAKDGFGDDDVNKVLSDNDFALGDRPAEEEESANAVSSVIASVEEDISEETPSEEAPSKEVTSEDDSSIEIPPAEADAAMEATKAKRGRFGILLPILFILIGIVILYYAGIFKGSSGPAEVSLEIMDLKGAFVQNEDVGKLYTLQGRIKNISEKSQEVVGVKVTIFDKAGLALTSKTVSLARLVSSEELKTLSGEELDRHYQDLSKGSIPPRGVTPLMVVFSDLPDGMDELEVEVVR